MTDPCETCHGDEGRHKNWCDRRLCGICGYDRCAGDCADQAWERWADK